VDEVSRFYEAQDQSAGTHIALRWKGRVRYTVPLEDAGQRACWKVFKPGKLGILLRAMASWPRLLRAVSCVESEKLASIRDAIGNVAGLSCCRAGAEGVWSKDTILFLDNNTAEPLFIAKAGAGEAVDALLRNEADWLRTLRGQASLIDRIPELIAHRSGKDFCFVAQRALSGELSLKLEESQFQFLQRLQEFSLQPTRYEDSRLYRTLNSRIRDLSGLLPEEWSSRLVTGMRRIEQSFSGVPILLVAAHNDFTPWNIRVEHGVAGVFDWEYADYEQFPLFDPLHFSLAPSALRSEPLSTILRKMQETMDLCEQWLGKERCYKAETQALAYFINLCTLYLWADGGKRNSHPTLVSYAQVIDHLCQDPRRS
jgi:hypothetical protein